MHQIKYVIKTKSIHLPKADDNLGIQDTHDTKALIDLGAIHKLCLIKRVILYIEKNIWLCLRYKTLIILQS